MIASALGTTVIAISSSDSKLKIAESLGAKHLIKYAMSLNWDQEVLRITGGKGADHVIEEGGAQIIMKSLNSARPGGLIILIGILSAVDILPPEFVPNLAFSGKISKGCVAFSRDTTAEFAKYAEERKSSL
ncbi:NAD(P)-binding protein [Zopfia rhizophila CBS 207.26]|uniref:NAD(P)-binding protein n=1 Tax=Zopfia rhizophila CBS 207.26 TaxID=1314779 RepID=A0A6A6EKI1_9PEZI|nr:NAD(P)-binding protein [Zopfia rhizophila CBS 207.26]